MKLDAKKAKVLFYAEMLAAASTKELAKLTGFQENTVRYQLDELKEAGVLHTKRAFINYMPLGLTPHVLLFSFRGNNPADERNFITALKAEPSVWWLASFGGLYQYAVSFAIAHVSELVDVVERLCSNSNVTLGERTISVRLAVHRFSRNYLVSKNTTPLSLSMIAGEKRYAADDLDRAILTAVAYRGESSNRDLAAQLNISPSTFDRRHNNLLQKGIIQGYFYEVNLRSMHIQQYRILFRSVTPNATIRQQIYDFCLHHPNIRKLVYHVGEWDYEAEVNVADATELVAICGELNHSLPNQIERLELVPLLQHHATPPFRLSSPT